MEYGLVRDLSIRPLKCEQHLDQQVNDFCPEAFGPCVQIDILRSKAEMDDLLELVQTGRFLCTDIPPDCGKFHLLL
ncbi:hypothetical protein TNIN_456391 [Trichonephila inaurata madagascariensis]|uniref:Uncharacterized protein n=1 Tax=Trichonephila inaurata madagascariensis TaxID=2747483 RepID=A0A8X7BX31_9ARAC|nr:hypothetical protein TNIN_456391 [Trichonephila inaurata madagascariensis]